MRGAAGGQRMVPAVFAERRCTMGTPSLVAATPYLIEQKYRDYGPEQHDVWSKLVRHRRPQLQEHACREYLEGYEIIGLQDDRLPDLSAITKCLKPRTGWSATPVSGFLPSNAFFEMLAARMFPTTTYLRGANSLEYIPEPDIFHDVFGHVPMHAHPVFADFLQEYGRVCARLTDKDQLERMGRLFWFTVEFGVIRQNGVIKLYGSGLISSHGESNYVIEGAKSGHGPEIRDFNLEQVLNQEFLVSEMQKVLYAVESFKQ